jgi:hypothetical protein
MVARAITLAPFKESKMTKQKTEKAEKLMDRLDSTRLQSARGGFGAGQSSDGKPTPDPNP